MLTTRFPQPPRSLAELLELLRIAANDPAASEQRRRDAAALPRPWDPATCQGELRRLMYLWLDDVVAWINEQHTWRTNRIVPHCWSEHPHLVHELSIVACLRWEAGLDLTPDAIHEWQRRTLPETLLRIVDVLGDGGCPPGRHQASPGESRHALYRNRGQVAERQARIAQDADAG